MKALKIKVLLIAIFVLVANISSVLACDIKFEIEKGKKEKYNINDEIVLIVKVRLSHRVCNVEMKDTKFQLDGLKVIGQKEWTEVSAGYWERKLKIKVLGNATGKPKLTVTRTCDRDSGYGEFVISSDVVKK